MPLLDMPLEQLKEYMGSSPCPADIDEYWDNAISDMKKIDPQVSITPSEYQVPNVECYDLYFTGLGGARVYAKYLRPKNAVAKHPAIIQLHGYMGDCGDWSNKLTFVSMGYSMFALDCRGQSGKSEDNLTTKGTTGLGHIARGLADEKENMLYRYTFMDGAQLAGIAMTFDEVDPEKVYAYGGSQGGGLALACAALEPRISKVALLYPFLSDYKRTWDMDKAVDAYNDIGMFFRRFDPRHERESEIFYKLGYIDVQNIVKRIKADVLFGVGLADTCCLPSTQFAAYNKILSKKDMLVYPDYGHEWLPGFEDKVFMWFNK